MSGTPYFKLVKLNDQLYLDVMFNFFSKVWYENDSKTCLLLAMNVITVLFTNLSCIKCLIFAKQYSKYIKQCAKYSMQYI